MVVINGVPFKRGFVGARGKREAEQMAERWQGSHAEHRGLLKHADKRDYVEVRRDSAMEEEYRDRYDKAQRGDPQSLTYQWDTQYT